MIRKTKALVAVLNWGLGHATRTIPIIKSLLDQDNEIILGSDGAAYDLLQHTFPTLKIHILPGYNVSYPTENMVWNMAIQLPKIYKTVRSEHKMVQKIVQSEDIQVVISDNRYGCYASETKNILITHQLNLQLPLAGNLINRLHAKHINRFAEVWVPDHKDRSLSGMLSDSKWLAQGIDVKHIGIQSRLSIQESNMAYDIAAVLSGPEPQRSILEDRLIPQLLKSGLQCILIKGKANSEADQKMDNLTIRSFASEPELSQIFCASKMIICRSGYSTIMDLHQLQKRALYIPTPGQTEQIYLAQRMADLQLGVYQAQVNLDIMKAWNTWNLS